MFPCNLFCVAFLPINKKSDFQAPQIGYKHLDTDLACDLKLKKTMYLTFKTPVECLKRRFAHVGRKLSNRDKITIRPTKQ